METQRPDCEQSWNIDAEEKDYSIDCLTCNSRFKAAPYLDSTTGEILQKTHDRLQTPPAAEKVASPGRIWHIIGALIGIPGIIAGSFHIPEVGLSTVALVLLVWLLATAIGGVLNRLERIAHHTEKLREELKKK